MQRRLQPQSHSCQQQILAGHLCKGAFSVSWISRGAYASLAKIAGSAKLESEEFVYSTAIRTTVRSRRSPWHECSTCRNRGSCVATYCNSEECSGAACPSSSRCCLSCTTDTNKKS
eukprot:g3941.t2